MQFTAIIHGGAQLFGPSSLPGSAGLLPSFGTDGTFSAWVAAGSHAEGDAHSGGTSGGIVYVDASGNIATDGPTVTSGNITVSSAVHLSNVNATVDTYGSGSAQISRLFGKYDVAIQSNFGDILFDFQGVKASINSNGDFTTIGDLTLSSGVVDVTSNDANAVTMSIEAAAAQSENLTEWAVSGGAVKAHVTEAGEFSNAVAGSSERFGRSASCSNVDTSAFGASSNAASAYSSAFGSLARAMSTWSTAIGRGTYSNFTQTTMLGAGSSATAANQFVCGSTSSIHNNVYFGKGVTDATPTSYTINGTGGSGTDIAGADINIAGGIGTGTGVGGDITFQYAAKGSAGSTANTLATAMTIDGDTGDITASGDLTLSAPTVPASASATGVTGTISFDSDYIYVCTATNTWKRVAIATW